MLRRTTENPVATGRKRWIWNDQADSYKPPGAVYASDAKVIIKEYDHTCPWTGTAIGSGNMNTFNVFVPMVFILLLASFGATILGASAMEEE
jgi:palmitoyltransferase ZDHHC9/14/18